MEDTKTTVVFLKSLCIIFKGERVSEEKKRKREKEERDIWPRTLPPARSLMSIAHAVMATIITVMSLMASEAEQEKYVKIIVRFN